MDPVVDRHTALVGIHHNVGTWAVDMDCTLVDILPYAEVAFHKVERLRSLLVEDKGVHCRLLLEEDRQVGSTPREHGPPSVDILALLMDALPILGWTMADSLLVEKEMMEVEQIQKHLAFGWHPHQPQRLLHLWLLLVQAQFLHPLAT